MIEQYRKIMHLAWIVAVSLFVWLPLAGNSVACEEPAMTMQAAIGWTVDSLDGNDASFNHIRQQIDAYISKGNKASSLVQKYKKTSQQHPNNAEAMFRWAYTTYLASDHWQTNVQKTHVLCGIYAAMGQPENPHSFEYARLRFILAKLDSRYSGRKEINELGGPLLSKALKSDFDLRYFGINALAEIINAKQPDIWQKCLHLTLELRKDFPKKVESIRMLGGLYSSRFVLTKESAYADQSLKYYREYLSIAPKNYSMRNHVLDMIRIVGDIRSNYKKRGILK